MHLPSCCWECKIWFYLLSFRSTDFAHFLRRKREREREGRRNDEEARKPTNKDNGDNTRGLRMNVARMPGSIIKIWKSSKIISIQIQMAQPSVEYEESWVCVSPTLTPPATATAAPTSTESWKKNVKYWKAPRKDVKNVKIWKLIFNSISWGALLKPLLPVCTPFSPCNNGQLWMLLGVVSGVRQGWGVGSWVVVVAGLPEWIVRLFDFVVAIVFCCSLLRVV